jgi:2-iminobutanoate/2-iminopropanoate deaminase
MQMIASDKAPAAIGPYCQAMQAGGFLFCSGQIGNDPETRKLAGADIRTQTLQVFKNMREILSVSGLDLPDVVKTTVFLAHMEDFHVMNDIYATEFKAHKPARSTVEVSGLPLNALIEVECIACTSDS